MNRFQRGAVVAFAASGLFIVSAQGVAAQEPQVPQTAPPAAEAQDRVELRGELVRVDSEAKTLVVKEADGTETEFRYNDETVITGAQDDAAGLATMSGAEVTVHYERNEYAATRTATKIEIAPRS
jgi:predicted NAD/FAD-binding protein